MLEKDGITLAEACKILKKEYAAKSRVWASWGDYDRNQFQRDCEAKGIGYPFGPTHLNAKSLFALRRAARRCPPRRAVPIRPRTCEAALLEEPVRTSAANNNRIHVARCRGNIGLAIAG